MNLKFNNYSDAAVLTTDSWAANTHISSGSLNNVNALNTGSEGQILVWKNGYPQWVDMPPAFAQYLAIIEHEQRQTT